MRLLITGDRNLPDRDLMWSILDRLHVEHHFTLLIHDARPKRNRRMLAENPDLVVAFSHDSESGHMTLIAEDAG